MGKLAHRFPRFPLLLKFLDAHEMLSVQVHPSDAHADLLPAGETGKTEAWVVLEAGPESRIYAGLKPGTTADDLRRALTNDTVADHLVCFTPKPGDGVFIPTGTVHSLGGDVGVMVFSKEHPLVIRYRSVEPVLTPVLSQERHGTVANVVFATGIDRRDDLGSPDRFDVYYGMADKRIGVARLDLPEILPSGAVADPPEAKV